ncbi:MAG: alpha,2-mannosyltransferase [Actinomycetota bacterium]|nr:alpha,2-mannosyltransferase [Actinomycetota bacterium]
MVRRALTVPGGSRWPSALRWPRAARAWGGPAGLWFVFTLAFAIRLAPMIRTGSLTSVMGHDDGPLYAASAYFLEGHLPYRDFAFAHPPGIVLLLSPFTALAGLTGDVVAMAVARLATVALGASVAVLVVVHLRRHAPEWALAGGVCYAVWRLPAGAGRTLEAEPIGAAALLVALLLLRDGRKEVAPGRLAVSGALLGAAFAVTLRAGPAIAVVAGYLLVVRGWRTSLAWAASATAAAATVFVPFAVAARGELVEQLARGQLDRSGDVGMVQHLQRFSDLTRLGGYDLPMAIDIMLATCVLVTVIAVLFIAWWQPESQLVVLLMGVQCAMVAEAHAYDHGRFALAAPMIVIATATAAHRLVPHPGQGLPRYTVVPMMGLTFILLTVTAVHNVVPRHPDTAPLRAFAAGHRCVWFDSASLAVAADALTRTIAEACPLPVDRYADLDDLGVATAFDDVWRARRTRELQTRLIKELGQADAVVTSGDDSDDVLGESFLGSQARDAVRAAFVAVGSYGEYTLWVRRT